MQRPDDTTYKALKAEISSLLIDGRSKASRAVNMLLVTTYWHIGHHIVEYEQRGAKTAEYGSELLNRLSHDLRAEFGKGFSRSNLFNIRQLYLRFPIIQTLSGQLSWSHYVELLKAGDEPELTFYLKQCEQERWSVRQLRRQMKSMLFHRLALSKDKQQVLDMSEKGLVVTQPEDLLRDPYIFEFLGLPERATYSESELERRLIDHLQQFLLEMGKGFAFIGRQYRISIGGRHFYVDLVFYHRILKCFVLIDLKRGEVQHEDIGQMNLYLNYFAREEGVEDDQPPVGIVLGAYKDHILMEYATEHITNTLFVSKYQLHLPDRALLQRQLEELLNDNP